MRILIALTLTFLIIAPAWAEGFRSAEFGMSMAEVRATEDVEWLAGETKETLMFPTKLGDFDVFAGYFFVDGRLVRGSYMVFQD